MESSPPSAPSSHAETTVKTAQKRPKSPPLAFEPTPNDSLAPLISPTSQEPTNTATMGRLSPLQDADGHGASWRKVVDQQAAAMQLLHEAFAAERAAWAMERERLYLRIGSLERLVRGAEGYSPAKSPTISPQHITSPSSRSTSLSRRLPSIAENDSPPTSLSQRREQAPQAIDIPSAPDYTSSHSKVQLHSPPTAVIVSEPADKHDEDTAVYRGDITHSPLPFTNRMAAGHTPLHAPRRPLTPPPKDSLRVDGIDDTPTRNNTQTNRQLSLSNSSDADDEDEDAALKGPLNLPELPNAPDEVNFTLEALSKRLEIIERDPGAHTPVVMQERHSKRRFLSDDKDSPVRGENSGDSALRRSSTQDHEGSEYEYPLAPQPTRGQDSRTLSLSHTTAASEPSSNILSPRSQALSPPSHTLSPSAGTTGLSRNTSHDRAQTTEMEERVQADFEQGGIRLKKKVSTNFGAPWGMVSGGSGTGSTSGNGIGRWGGS